MASMFYRHHEIDKKQWDICLERSPQSLLYGLSDYLDIVSPRWSAIIEQNDQYYSHILPLPLTQLYGFDTLRQPLFTQQLGAFSQTSTFSMAFLNFVENFFLKQSYISPYQFNAHNLDFSFLKNSAFQPRILHTHHLDLRKPYVEIIKNMSHDRLKNLKIAYKTDWELETSLDIEPLIEMFRQTAAKKIQGGVSLQAYDLLRKIHVLLEKKGLGKLYYAKFPDGHRAAGVLLAFWKNTIIYLFNANDPYCAKCNARLWILDQVFKEYADQDWLFDFESPEVPSIAYFYESFGAKPIPYAQVWYNKLPFWAEALRKTKRYFWKCFNTFM